MTSSEDRKTEQLTIHPGENGMDQVRLIAKPNWRRIEARHHAIGTYKPLPAGHKTNPIRPEDMEDAAPPPQASEIRDPAGAQAPLAAPSKVRAFARLLRAWLRQ